MVIGYRSFVQRSFVMPASSVLRVIPLVLSLVLASASAALVADAKQGFSERPIGTQTSAATVPDNSMVFFRNKDFRDKISDVTDVTAKESWRHHSFDTQAKHFSSLRWNLPRGVLVTLFSGNNCDGMSLSIWGAGEVANLSDWKLNDELAGWSWNYVGGVADASKTLRDAQSPRPKFVKETQGVEDDSLLVYRKANLKGDATTITQLTTQPANAFQELPKGTSSMKWKLPEGVVVTFSEKADGRSPGVAVWGSGQIDSFAVWQMNDKLRYWSWQWIGSK